MTMTKWEYACLTTTDIFKDGTWSHREFSFEGPGGSTKPVQGRSALPILNLLGEEGWEVFHVETMNRVYYNKIGDNTYPTAEPAMRNYFLKRPTS
jgi:hypothetical protein